MISIQKLLLRNMIIIAFISIGILYFLWIQNEYSLFILESESIKEKFVIDQKERLEKEVQNVLDYIQYMKNQTEKRLKDSIKGRVYEAYYIALNIHRENENSKSDNEIKKMIKDALRPIRFNNGQGYYFAFTMDGIEELFADRPEMEGKNMLAVQGAKGEFVVRDMIEMLNKKKEGFYTYTWSKPNEKEKNFKKIAFVKYFEPFGWGIGTGEYVDDTKAQIQNEVLERISKLRFNKEGYFFGSVYGGRPLFTNGKITRGTKSVWDLTDPNGVKIIQEQNIAAKKPDGGFVYYSWQRINLEKLSPKLSYVKGIPEWEWIVGAGIYLDTIDAGILVKKKALYDDFFKKAVLSFAVLIVMSILIYLWTRFNAKKIQTGIKFFSQFFDKASKESTFIEPDTLQFEEFGDIAASANKMLENRLKAIHALQLSEKRYEAITNSAQDAIFCKDINRRYAFVNPAMAKMFNCDAKDLIGKKPEQLFDPDFAEIIADVDNRTFNGENVSEIRTLEINGKEYVFHTVQVPLEVVDGKVSSISGIVRDITENTLADIALKEEKKFTEEALNAQLDTFFVFNPESKKALRWNKAFNMVSGYSDKEILSMKAPDNYYSRADLKKASIFIDKVLKNEPSIVELYLITKTGKKISMEYTASAVKNSRGETKYIITIGRDITERKQIEKEKYRSEQRVTEQEKHALVGRIAGKISHDFNNILGVIMGNTQLSLLNTREPKTKKTLELIFEQTIRGKNLTKNLVAFAKDQEPKQEFFKISEKIDLVLNLLKKDLEGIELIKEDKPGVPELLADSGMIEHALVNLLQNSIHAISMVEHPRIITRTYSLDENICFEVEDNGCGIPEEYLHNIYEPSFTLKGSKDVSGSYESGIKGTGYGMSNVKKYIEQHRGSIFVESVVGSGTKFTISLPVVKKELTSEEKIQIRKEKIYFDRYILVVEDEQAISDIQYTILTHKPCNHKVDIANNGQVAMDLFERNKYDLISLDYILPGNINGMDVYNHIRETNKTIPILFISGNIEFLESIKELKQKDNNIDHLSKPCQNKDYVNSINELLERSLGPPE